MYDKDPSGFHAALGLARSAALEGLWAANRSPDYAPSGDESEQGLTESSRKAREANVVLSNPGSNAHHDAFASQLTDTSKSPNEPEAGAKWSYGDEIAGEFVCNLIVETLFAPFTNW